MVAALKQLKYKILVFAILILIQSIGVHAQSLESRIIIRFTANVNHPNDPVFVRQLSETAKSTLTYLRILSAHRNTHLYQSTLFNDALTDDQIIKFLSQRGDVVYAEKDVTYQINTK